MLLVSSTDWLVVDFLFCFCFVQVGGALVDVLRDEEGGVIPFEFVKSIGKSICPLNLFSDKELTGATLAGLCRQGPIYVRATKQLRFWPMEDVSDDDEDNEEFKRRAEQVPEKSARGTCICS